MNSVAPPLADRLARARRETLALLEVVEESDRNRSLHPEFSPLRWHFGHIAVFEAYWIGRRAGGQPSPNPEYDRLFDPRSHSKRDRVHLPDWPELLAFADGVRQRSLAVLAGASPDHPHPLLREGYVGELIYEHECQHQEIMTFLLQMVPPERKRPPGGGKPEPGGVEPEHDAMVTIPGGSFVMGALEGAFAYDNERPPHPVILDTFAIDRSPVTERAFVRFLEEGGYRTERLWRPEGWRWRCEQGIEAPRDWSATEGGGWRVRTLFEDRDPAPGVPVVGVSWYEAQAYARWLGRRLPTEAEWERAAGWDAALETQRRFPWGERLPSPDRANTDGRAWGTRPIRSSGRSPAGCDEMAGQVWEWTATDFAPYPGFQPYPYRGYSQDWFDGQHRVLRGGSWATRGPLCRTSFRNWYHPHVREGFAGFRCARSGR